MACFLVPMGEAVITTVLQKVVEKKEKEAQVKSTSQTGLKWSRKLSWLNRLLWGGVLLLAMEHAWHGEIVPWPPFLTAMSNPAQVGPMLHEMATIGTGMALFVTLVWALLILIVDLKVTPLAAKIKTDA
ncbi:MAG: hypothetical protein ACOX37_04700 [Bacillota bacterium]